MTRPDYGGGFASGFPRRTFSGRCRGCCNRSLACVRAKNGWLMHRYRQLSGPGRRKAPVFLTASTRKLSGILRAIARQMPPDERKG